MNYFYFIYYSFATFFTDPFPLFGMFFQDWASRKLAITQCHVVFGLHHHGHQEVDCRGGVAEVTFHCSHMYQWAMLITATFHSIFLMMFLETELSVGFLLHISN